MLSILLNSFLQVRLLDIIDIILVAILLFELYQLLKGTAAINIFFGIIAVFAAWRVVKILEMELLAEILGAFISVGFIALIVVFQPEIRKFLLMLGTPGFIKKHKKRFLFWKLKYTPGPQVNVDAVVQACHKMALSKTGALIVIARKNNLQEYIDTGESINASISDQLIETIFFKNTPLHDGAIIISDNHIAAARCILPVSSNQEIPSNYGLRHRSALGISERSDAIAIVVSEQTGKIAYCTNASITAKIEPSQLKNMLEEDWEMA
ncbi:MAG: diadenylate cyclase CdaA [Lentimicrobiaceae bacterium]|nr:diadenylate cyclase CdaA [Lentimicrobiaceae bacterium]